MKSLPWWTILFIVILVIIFVVFLAWIFWQQRTITRAPDLKGLLPAKNFTLEKYASTANDPATIWHEIAKIPNSFEANLTQITAEYLLRPNGTISVVNKGLQSNGQTSSISGQALVTNLQAVLMVSFFPFFESPYVVLYVDDTYTSAIVGSPSQSLLWFLARGSAVATWTPAKTMAFKQIAVSRGYSQESVNKIIQEATLL